MSQGRQEPEREHLFPQDKVRWRLARKLEQEYLSGALDEDEYEQEMEALHDALVGE